MGTNRTGGASAGVVDTIRSFLASGVALIQNRVEIISLEIEEQREWLEQLVIMAVGAMFCLSLGLLLLTLFIVVLFWENYRLWVLGGFSLLYLGGGIVLFLMLRNKAKSKPKFFATTAAELSKDHAHLQPGNP